MGLDVWGLYMLWTCNDVHLYATVVSSATRCSLCIIVLFPNCMSQKGKVQTMWIWQVSLQDMSIRHRFAIVARNGACHPRIHKHLWRTSKRTGLFTMIGGGRAELASTGCQINGFNWSQDADLGELVTLYAQRHWDALAQQNVGHHETTEFKPQTSSDIWIEP